jgi:hypothetical protein
MLFSDVVIRVMNTSQKSIPLDNQSISGRTASMRLSECPAPLAQSPFPAPPGPASPWAARSARVSGLCRHSWCAGRFSCSAGRALARADLAYGAVSESGYLWASLLKGGFTVLELPSRKEAVA